MVYHGPHPVHEAWAHAVGARLIDYTLIGATIRRLFGADSLFTYAFYTFCSRFFKVFFHFFPSKTGVAIVEGIHPLLNVIPLKRRKWKIFLLAVSSLVNYSHEFLLKLLKNVDAIIAVSKLTFDSLNKLTDAPVRIVYPFIDIDRFKKINADLRSENIVFVGRLDWSKGVDMLPAIYKIIRKEFKNVNMYILGQGPLKKLLMKNVRKGFYPLGYISRPEDYFRRASIYVHPARYDSFPISVLEAMASGLIPIVTNMTGTKDAVEKVSPDLVVKPRARDIAKKILEILRMDIKDRKDLSERARKVAFNFNKSRSIKQFMETFQYLLKCVSLT